MDTNGAINANVFPNLPLYGTIVGCFVVAALAVMGGIAFYKGKDTAEAFTTLIQRANIIQMLAVVMIIMAAVGLRLLDKITPEAVVSILSGIAGYVLGGVARTGQDAQRTEPDKHRVPERNGAQIERN